MKRIDQLKFKYCYIDWKDWKPLNLRALRISDTFLYAHKNCFVSLLIFIYMIANIINYYHEQRYPFRFRIMTKNPL